MRCDDCHLAGGPTCCMEDGRARKEAEYRDRVRKFDQRPAKVKRREREMSEPKTTDYCARCQQSPEAAVHMFPNHDDCHEYIHPRQVCEFQRYDSKDLNARPCGVCVICKESAEKRLSQIDMSEVQLKSMLAEGRHDDRSYMKLLQQVANSDVKALEEKDKAYGGSWQRRGGVGAFMMAARKWDRLENAVKNHPKEWNIFDAVATDTAEKDGVIDDVRDLRRYLMLVEAYLIEQGDVEPF